jgi:hypothetical protein
MTLQQARLDLRARAMYQHQLHAQGREQIQIVREIVEPSVGNEVAAESDDEYLSSESMDVRRDRLKPVDEAVLAR